MQFLTLSLFALGAAAIAIEKRGGGGPPPPPLCGRLDWLDISYADIEDGTAELGFTVPDLVYGTNYTAQIIVRTLCLQRFLR